MMSTESGRTAPQRGGRLNARATRLALALAAAGFFSCAAAEGFTPLGGEYPMTLGMAGDQVFARLVLNSQGGYLVWQDNAADGDGSGLRARRLDATFSPVASATSRINRTIQGDQEHPAAVLMKDGGLAVAWESGDLLDRDVYLRLLKPDGTFLTDEIRVNQRVEGIQKSPAAVQLAGGNLAVIWSSVGQDGSLQGVYGRLFSPEGAPLGDEFRVNVFTAYNQRDPAVAAMGDGGFVAVWISENQSFFNSVDVVARRFTAEAEPISGDVRVNAATNVCANPVIAAFQDGRFAIAWSARNPDNFTNRWDVALRTYEADGRPLQDKETILNQHRSWDQFAPQLAAVGDRLLAVWTSMGQDGSREGIYGRFVDENAVPLGDEFRVNATTVSRQIYPAAASDGESRFLVCWSSFVGGPAGFDLFGQRFASDNVLRKPDAPLAVVLDARRILVSWPALSGIESLDAYLVFQDESSEPRETSERYLIVKDLAPGTSHSFCVAYRLKDGRISPKSDAASARTWGWDDNFDGLPDDWQARFWGAEPGQWPAATADSDGDGASNRAEFLAGTDPTDAASVLRLTLKPTAQGLRAEWNATPGSVYRLQKSTDLKNWRDVGDPQFAAGKTASMIVSNPGAVGYYRIVRIR